MNSGITLEEETNVEVNSGVDFPGQCMEPLMNSALRINQLKQTSSNQTIVIEFRENSADKFAFKCLVNQVLVIGVCEYCNKKNIMNAICKCKNVKYCNEACLDNDKRFHVDKCSAMADGELQNDDLDAANEDSKNGLVGL